MKKRYTYKLLMQSEEKSRNILETAAYGLVAMSALVSIWQFAEQPPMQSVQKSSQQHRVVQIAS
jgi:hypothetical protein